MGCGGVEDGVHSADLNGKEADRTGREPRLPNVVVGTAEEPFGLHAQTGHVDNVTARRPHSKRTPPGAVNGEIAGWDQDHAPAAVVGHRDYGVREAVDPRRKVFLPCEPAIDKPQGVARCIRIPYAEDAPLPGRRNEPLALARRAVALDQIEGVHMSLENPAHAEIAPTDGG